MTKERNWINTFSNGYYGCDEEVEIVGTYDEATNYANELLMDYTESMSHAAFGWDAEYTKEEYDEYIANCSYDIEESGVEYDE